MPDARKSPDLASLLDDEQTEAYERTSGKAGDDKADRLLAEIQRRGLDV